MNRNYLHVHGVHVIMRAVYGHVVGEVGKPHFSLCTATNTDYYLDPGLASTGGGGKPSVNKGERMKSEFLLAFNQICSDRGLPGEVVLDALQMALVSAYRRSTDANPNQVVSAKIDLETGKARVYVEKQVVDEVSDTDLEIALQKARAIQPKVSVGDVVLIESTPDDFGRIAAQSAKQIILQRIREAEREARYEHYVQQEGEIVHGTVQSIKPQAVTLHLEGTEAILPRSQQVPGERYDLHQRLRAYVLEVRKTGRGPQIVVSRSHKNMLRRLLELEVPEIFNGAVEIKSTSREAGSRSKVAVVARQPGVDPVGACVGMRGVRIQSIVNELGGEKIDVIEWSPNPATFIAKALSPARVLSVQLEEDPVEGKTANVVVPDDQLSLAIGRAGQNARLAAKLTGWRIDIQGCTEAATWALQRVNEDPNVLPALGLVAELLPSVASSLRQHEQDGMPYHSEELLNMRQVIEAVRHYYVSIRDAERARLLAEEASRRAAIETAEAERRATIEAARASIPPRSFDVSLDEIGLSSRVRGHLERGELTNVGEVMERLAEGDEGLLRLEGVGPKSLAEIKKCIEALDLLEVEEAVLAEEEAAAEAEAVLPVEPVLEAATEAMEEGVAEEEEAVPVGVLEAEADEVVEEVPVEEALIAEVVAVEEEPAVLPEPVPVAEPAVEVEEMVAAPEPVEEAEPEEGVAEETLVTVEARELLFEQDEELEAKLEEDRRRGRQLRRELVYDEDLGEVVTRRRRKREQDVDEFAEWGEF
jgi:N utilization substance protein A